MARYLTDQQYAFVTGSVPLPCVDTMAVRQTEDGSYELGVITRATGSQSGKLALIGGRVEYEEPIDKALARHLQTDLGLGPGDWKLLEFPYRINTPQRPFYTQQYWPANESEAPYGYDPSKHSIASTFLIRIKAEPKPAKEATNFRWVTEQDVMQPAAYNQHFVMQEAFRFLREMAAERPVS